MRFAATTAFATLAIFAISGCVGIFGGVQGSGKKGSEERKVGDFSKIKVEGSGDIHVVIGSETKLAIETDDNLLELITTEVRGDTLVISSRKGYNTKLGVKIDITTPKLTGVTVSGSGDVNVEGLKTTEIAFQIKGSGDFRATGTTDALSVGIDGSGGAKLEGLAAKTATASINGSGDISLNVSGELNAYINGSGDVSYTGHPIVKKIVNGSGSVDAK